MKYVIPVGTTEPQDFALVDAGEPIDGSGLTVALEIKRKVGSGVEDVTSPPTVAWLDQSGGTVRVSGAGSLTAGSYYVRYKLTSGGTFGFAPNGEHADIWHLAAVAS